MALIEFVAAVLKRHVKPGDRLTVGFSGGRDSVVLLSLLQKLRDRFNFDLAAHHVNHQISPNAKHWAKFCADFCLSLDVPFQQSIIDVPRDTGKGLEAAARTSRYAAFRELDTDFIVLGHHQDDQAETLLLRLFRGSGAKGLAAMRECSQLPKSHAGNSITSSRLLRPLLHLPRSTLVSYAHNEKLSWIDDESNMDAHYTRNYFRTELLPRIEQRFPAYRAVLDRAAEQFAETRQLLDVLAASDGKESISGERINVRIFAELDEPRAKNLLRYFLGQHGLKMPNHDRLQEMLRQATSPRDDAMVCLIHDGIELRRFRDWLCLVRPLPALPADFRMSWNGEMRWPIPALHGTMEFQETSGRGISKKWLVQHGVSVRLRQGGEKLRLDEHRPRQTLKNLLQGAAIPPWERDRLPILYIGEDLACVPGVGATVPFQARPDEDGMTVSWTPQPQNLLTCF